MTASESPATPQLGFLSPRVALRRRRRSPKCPPADSPEHGRREKSDPIADKEHPLVTLRLSKSAVTVFPTPRQHTPPTPKSP
jgi:hypothetical protein